MLAFNHITLKKKWKAIFICRFFFLISLYYNIFKYDHAEYKQIHKTTKVKFISSLIMSIFSYDSTFHAIPSIII